jgi:holo-[acyl-carrier protein] synthase
MSVVGIGTDILDIRRIIAMKMSVRTKLAERVLTPSELIIYKSHANESVACAYLAKRWSGKEAAAKALGTGIASGVSFQHFTIKSLPSGQPQLELSDIALAKAKALGAKTWHISLSDEKHYASSFVVLSD